MIEVKLTLTEAERQALKEMSGLVQKIAFWKNRPWILGALLSMCAAVALILWSLYFAIEAGRFSQGGQNRFSEDFLAFSVFGSAVVGLAVLVGLGLKLFIYGPRVRRAQNRLDLIARSPEGRVALGAVREFLKIEEEFQQFLVFSGEGSFPDWALVKLSKRYVTGP